MLQCIIKAYCTTYVVFGRIINTLLNLYISLVALFDKTTVLKNYPFFNTTLLRAHFPALVSDRFSSPTASAVRKNGTWDPSSYWNVPSNNISLTAILCGVPYGMFYWEASYCCINISEPYEFVQGKPRQRSRRYKWHLRARRSLKSYIGFLWTRHHGPRLLEIQTILVKAF